MGQLFVESYFRGQSSSPPRTSDPLVTRSDIGFMVFWGGAGCQGARHGVRTSSTLWLRLADVSTPAQQLGKRSTSVLSSPALTTLRHTHAHARTHTRHTPDRLLYVDHRDDADSPALTTRSVSRSVLLPTTTSGTYWARPPPPPRP